MAPLYIFRQYTCDDSFLKVFVPSTIVKEYQIALTYARDYNGVVPTNGVFRPTWNLTKVTSEAISQFKKNNPGVTVKVFICIGNKQPRFPFSPRRFDSWITNATESITDIIRKDHSDLKIDGIDVSYNNITAESEVFVQCISQVIKNLKDDGVISVASISPSSHLNKEFYVPLYKKCPNLIDRVDYQFQKEEATVPDPQTLLAKYDELVEEYDLKEKEEKLFAGYSAENEDWGTVSPIVFFLGAMDILHKKGAVGFSINYHDLHQPNSTPNQ
ncbi:hypothetical protein PIB30_025764 [Stylosanthes scabra]|uniref:Uncharacterized protein n=1 Tax=Stylosanthes scabra TaxID=79078 RepID=A0ABU6RAG0_9FABA|nr:hypothetical protein [Stylosanthes scabra]